jgi:hypothetical protein
VSIWQRIWWYEKVVGLMKQLSVNDPRFFEQQWLVNCAYYDGMYSR